jgi:hypothetical protein
MSLTITMPVLSRKEVLVQKQNNVAKSIRYFKIMVIKQAEQPNNCEAAQIYSIS